MSRSINFAITMPQCGVGYSFFLLGYIANWLLLQLLLPFFIYWRHDTSWRTNRLILKVRTCHSFPFTQSLSLLFYSFCSCSFMPSPFSPFPIPCESHWLSIVPDKMKQQRPLLFICNYSSKSGWTVLNLCFSFSWIPNLLQLQIV